jgi:hypothetical protein
MAKKIKPSSDEGVVTIISTEENEIKDRIIKIYEKDPRKAKIIFDNEGGHNLITFTRLFVQYENGDFRIPYVKHSFGISKNAIRYTSTSNETCMIYKKATNSFYFKHRGGIRSLTYHQFINSFGSDVGCEIYNDILNKFSWIRTVSECGFLRNLSFSLIMRKKLFSLKSLYGHVFDCPFPISKMIVKNTGTYSEDYISIIRWWKNNKHGLDNIENLSSEMLKNGLFKDTLRFANTLGLKLNCSWSPKRLRLEHDNFSKIITNTILEYEEVRDLNVFKLYSDFESFSDFQLFKTNHDLIGEGLSMKHCVATYGASVDSGSCGIFKAYGCTLQLGFYEPIKTTNSSINVGRRIHINQYMGFNNSRPPASSFVNVQAIIDEFNLNLDSEHYDKLLSGHVINNSKNINRHNYNDIADLPF